MKNSWIVALIVVVLFFSCKTNKVFDPEEYQGKKIILTHGGGFTGATKTYILLDNGQVFKKNNGLLKSANDPDPQKLTIDKKVVKQMFVNIDNLGLKKINKNEPGNLTYSITIKDSDGTHMIQWGKGQKDTEMLQMYYSNVMRIIKNAGSKDKKQRKFEIE